MNREELLKKMYEEERVAHIHGWDFSHIRGKYEEGKELPWDYRSIIQGFLKPEMKLLDIDTGGGEFLLSLNHPYELLAATEGYEPNVELCREKLLPLGIDFKQANGDDVKYPYEDHSFDMIINRHGDFNASEIKRLLKVDGIFITQQVGAENDRELVELLYEEVPDLPFPKQYLKTIASEFEQAGFEIIRGEEAYCPIKFWDVGALVWFAHIIEWEFTDFSVDKCLKGLYKAQDILNSRGVIEGRIHRFLLVAKAKL